MDTVIFKPKRSDYWVIYIISFFVMPICIIFLVLFTAIEKRNIDMSVFLILTMLFSLSAQSAMMKDILLKQITFADEIVFEFHLLKPIHQPLNDIVTIGAKEIEFKKFRLNLSYLRNGAECTNQINQLISSGTLLAASTVDKTKMNQKQKWMFCLSILGLILLYALPFAYGILYSRMPVHIIGQMSDSALIFVLLTGLIAVIQKQIEKSKTCTNH
jgi:hypothetical protein